MPKYNFVKFLFKLITIRNIGTGETGIHVKKTAVILFDKMNSSSFC